MEKENLSTSFDRNYNNKLNCFQIEYYFNIQCTYMKHSIIIRVKNAERSTQKNAFY